jgi:hypothetical protein
MTLEGHDGYDNVTTVKDILYRDDQRSLDNGDVELGTIIPSPTSQLARTSAVVSGSHIARPIIHRGNSKSGIVNNVATGKEEVRVQSAWVCYLHNILLKSVFLNPLLTLLLPFFFGLFWVKYIDCIDPIGTFTNGTTTT